MFRGGEGGKWPSWDTDRGGRRISVPGLEVGSVAKKYMISILSIVVYSSATHDSQ